MNKYSEISINPRTGANYHMELTWNRNFTVRAAFAMGPLGQASCGRPSADSKQETNAMIRQRNTLLAGVAALTLVAGAGFAAAQEGAKEKAPQGKPAAAQPMNKAPEAGKMGSSAQEPARAPMTKEQNHAPAARNAAEEQHRTAAEPPSQRADEKNRANKTNTDKANKTDKDEMNRAEKTDTNKADKAAESRDQRKPDAAAAQRDRKGMEGLQGNASGVNVKLTDAQRSRIRTTVIDAGGASRMTNVNFDITVGTIVPRGSIEIVPVPDALVEIEPEWRGFLYFIYEDEVVIVNPDDMRIVAVIAV
jgi:hypothetical protein